MDYQIITFSKENFPDQNIWDLCDQQLEKHLSQINNGIAVILLSEMATGVDLLNWLSKWQNQCEESSKQFFIITEDTDQQECIEFSHPDLNLVYFSSIEELLNTYPEFSQDTKKRNNRETSSKPVFDFNYNSIPPNVEDKINYPEVVKDDFEIIDSSNPQDFAINDSILKNDKGDDSGNNNNPENDNMLENNIDPEKKAAPIFNEDNKEKKGIEKNENEKETKHDVDFTDTIKKDIDTLIEEKINEYFKKRNLSDNSIEHHIDSNKKKKSTGEEKILLEPEIVDSENIIRNTSLYEENRIVVDIGSIIEVAGEYECSKCNFKRMYIKGDIADKCENPECLSSLSGWKLSFDLF
ncbi:MAG: hypothetical protein PVI26_00605 [Chitinispirillia bacterium]